MLMMQLHTFTNLLARAVSRSAHDVCHPIHKSSHCGCVTGHGFTRFNTSPCTSLASQRSVLAILALAKLEHKDMLPRGFTAIQAVALRKHIEQLTNYIPAW